MLASMPSPCHAVPVVSPGVPGIPISGLLERLLYRAFLCPCIDGGKHPAASLQFGSVSLNLYPQPITVLPQSFHIKAMLSCSSLFHYPLKSLPLYRPSAHRRSDISLKAFSIQAQILSSLLVQWIARVGLEEQELQPNDHGVKV